MADLADEGLSAGKSHGPRENAGLTAVVVVNQIKVGPEQHEILRRALAHEGVEAVRFEKTTPEDPGVGQARSAVESGADLVIAWGGDGTVMACVTGLAGSDVPLGIIPGGTGNLLARNLDIPLSMGDSVHVAVHGKHRRIDVGVVGDEKFAVMAGMGFDAAMLRDASEQAKSRVGPAAYVASGLSNLPKRGFDCTLTVDDQPPRQSRARTVLVGNVGKLQGGLPLLPDAVPDDGWLDIVVIKPRTTLEWVVVAWRVMIRRPHPRHMDCMRGRRVLVESRTPQPYELDGDVRGETTRMLVEIEPGAVVVCVP
ncbi:MAG: diacylglycerol kinase [Actinomycetota bacterium]|nr:diacylglycerol kinase [Actinomycetota bacterium]